MRVGSLILSLILLAGCSSFHINHKRAAWEWQTESPYKSKKHGFGFYNDDLEYRWKIKFGSRTNKHTEFEKVFKKEFSNIDK